MFKRKVANKMQIILFSIMDIARHSMTAPNDGMSSSPVQYDKTTMLQIVSRDGLALEHAPEELKNDKDIALVAVIQDPRAFNFVGEVLKKSRHRFLLEAIRATMGLVFQYIDLKFQDELYIVMLAVSLDPTMLQYASEGMQKDRRVQSMVENNADPIQREKTIMFEAVQMDGDYLIYASEELKSDKDIAREAVKQKPTAFLRIHQDLQYNRDFIEQAIQETKGAVFQYLDSSFQSDPKIAMGAIIGNPAMLQYVSQDLQSNRDFIADALQATQGRVLQYFSKAMMLELVKERSIWIEHAPEELKNDKDIALVAVIQDPRAFNFVGEVLKRDRSFAWEAVRKTEGAVFEFLPQEFLNDFNIARSAVWRNPDMLQYASQCMREDPYFIWQVIRESQGKVLQSIPLTSEDYIRIAMLAVALDSEMFRHVAQSYQENKHIIEISKISKPEDRLKRYRQIILADFEQSGVNLSTASSEVKSDPELMLAIISQDASAFEFVDQKLKERREFAWEAIRQTEGAAFQYTLSFQDDTDVALSAVSRNSEMLRYASERVKGVRQVVNYAVSNRKHGPKLQYASETLRNDVDIVKKAVNCDINALKYAGQALRSDPGLMLHVLKKDFDTFKAYASDDLRKNKEFALLAFIADKRMRLWLDSTFLEDRDFALQAITKRYELLKICYGELSQNQDEAIYHVANLQEDRSFMLAVINKSPNALEYALPRWKADPDLALKFVNHNGYMLQHVAGELNNTKAIVRAAVNQYGMALKCAHIDLKNDRDIVLEAVKQNGMALQHAGQSLKADKPFLLQCMKEHGFVLGPVHCDILEYVDPTLRDDEDLVLAAGKRNPRTFKYSEERFRSKDFMDRVLAECPMESLPVNIKQLCLLRLDKNTVK